MAMPSPFYPQLTVFEVSEIHFDGQSLVLRNQDKEHIFTVNLLSCYGAQSKIYQHEPSYSSENEEEPLDKQDENLRDNAQGLDEPIPF